MYPVKTVNPSPKILILASEISDINTFVPLIVVDISVSLQSF